MKFVFSEEYYWNRNAVYAQSQNAGRKTRFADDSCFDYRRKILYGNKFQVELQTIEQSHGAKSF